MRTSTVVDQLCNKYHVYTASQTEVNETVVEGQSIMPDDKS